MGGAYFFMSAFMIWVPWHKSQLVVGSRFYDFLLYFYTFQPKISAAHRYGHVTHVGRYGHVTHVGTCERHHAGSMMYVYVCVLAGSIGATPEHSDNHKAWVTRARGSGRPCRSDSVRWPATRMLAAFILSEPLDHKSGYSRFYG